MNEPRHGQRPRTADTDGRRRCAACSAPLAADNTARLCGRCHRDQRDQLRNPPVHHSDEFWATDDLRRAFESQHIGRVFKAYRHHARHLQLLGKALNQELLGRWLGLTQAQVSKLENGKPEQNLETLRAYAKALHIPQRLLWFDLPGETRITAREARDDVADSRVETIILPAAASTPNPANQLDPRLSLWTTAPTDDDPILHIRRLTDARTHFERMYRNSGGVVVGSRIDLFLARHAFSLAATIDENEGSLKRAIGGLVALAGVCAYDSEDWVSANAHFRQALKIAEMTGDYGFHAYTLALMVNQSLALEDYKAAENLANLGLRSAAKVSAASLTIDLQMMRAKALAAMGDSSAAKSVIHKLETEIGRLPAEESNGIAEASYAQTGHLQALLAEALTSLGDWEAAQRFAEQSLLSDAHAKGKVNRLASMTTLEIARGEIERASSLACEMVENAQGMESRRLGSRFAKIRESLASRPTAASREAVDRIGIAITLVP